MPKRLAILLSLIFLVGQTPLQQLLKLPLLIDHYNQHHEEMHQNKSLHLGVMDFLEEHYLGKGAGSEQEEDTRLPFKKYDMHFMGGSFVCPPVNFDLLYPLPLISSQYSDPGDISICDLTSANIWQPPRV